MTIKVNPAIKAIAQEFKLDYAVVNNLVEADKKNHPTKKLNISDVYLLVSDYFNQQTEDIKKEIGELRR